MKSSNSTETGNYTESSLKQEKGAESTSSTASGTSGDLQCEKGLSKNESSEHRSPDKPTTTSISQNEPSCRENISAEVEAKFVLLVLRFLKALQFNTHELAGWDEEREKDHSVGFGGALYPTLALFNHSCSPNIVRYFVNGTVVVRAIRTILPYEVVTENYGPNYSTTPVAERKSQLAEQYLFQCDCIACKEDWPSFEKMTDTPPNDMMKFRCEHCRTFICKSDENMGILFKCGKCGKSVNILKALKSIHETDAKYNQAVKFISAGQRETGLGMLEETLFMLETFLMPPFRELHMCQEHMRRCYLAMGNRICKLPVWDPENVKVDQE